jgi:hypothetical protein
MKERKDEATVERDELREHYDFDYSKAKPNRFASRFSQDAIVVVLDPDVAAVFQTSDAVNNALRVLISALGKLAETSRPPEAAKGDMSRALSSPT